MASSATTATASIALDAVARHRKERAKILSRLFAAAASSPSSSKPPSGVPAKGSIFVLGLSLGTHLENARQRSVIRRVIRGLAAHYTVLVVVAVDERKSSSNNNNEQHPATTTTTTTTTPHSSTGDYSSTEAIHTTAERILRGSNDDAEHVPAAVLPSHRVLLSSDHGGRVALVRQLSSNIALTVDFDPEVRTQLRRFGYEVAVVDDWETVL